MSGTEGTVYDLLFKLILIGDSGAGLAEGEPAIKCWYSSERAQ